MRPTHRIAVPLVFFLILLVSVVPVSAYSSEAVAWYTQGNALLQSQNYTQAVSAYDHAIALEPRYFEAGNAKADALNRDGEFSAALAASDQALAANPDYAEGWINRGQILYNIGYVYEDQKKDLSTANEYYAKQLLAFEKAIELDPSNAEAWFNKAYALAGMKRYDDAISAFDKVQALNPDYPNLAKNRQIAVQLRDASTPVYVTYAGVIIGGVGICACIIIWLFYLREKPE
jgi:tetratricopeptide (TPR) repeat protein